MAPAGTLTNQSKLPQGYTEFYILGVDGSPDDYPRELAIGEEAAVSVCVVNHEGKEMDYRVEMSTDPKALKTLHVPSLKVGERWEQKMAFRAPGEGPDQKVEIHLYKMDEAEPYSILRLWVDVGVVKNKSRVPNYPVIKWALDIGVWSMSEPAVAPDGTIYVGAEAGMNDYSATAGGRLLAINPSGVKKWELTCVQGVNTPIIAADGTTYITAHGDPFKNVHGRLYAVNPDGTVKWQWEIEPCQYVFLPPVLGADGTIYVAHFGHVYAFNADGTQKWDFLTDDKGYYNLSFTSDGTIYAGLSYVSSGYYKSYAINLDGTKKWKFQIGEIGQIHGTGPKIGPSGTIYVSNENIVYAINPDGNRKWERDCTGGFSTVAAVGNKGAIYLGSTINGTYVIERDLSMKRISIFSAEKLTVDCNDVLLVLSRDSSKLYSLDSDGKGKWVVNLNGCFSSMSKAPVLARGGEIYVTANNCSPKGSARLYAIEAGPIPELPRTVHVDYDFTDDPLNHRWNTIQKGIDDATPGSIVIVHPGIYHENVEVNKPIILKGEGVPIVDTGGKGMGVMAETAFCIPIGFQVVGSNLTSLQARVVDVDSQNNYLVIWASGLLGEIKVNLSPDTILTKSILPFDPKNPPEGGTFTLRKMSITINDIKIDDLLDIRLQKSIWQSEIDNVASIEVLP